MSRTEMRKVLSRTLYDDDFLNLVLTDADAALQDYDLTLEERKALTTHDSASAYLLGEVLYERSASPKSSNALASTIPPNTDPFDSIPQAGPPDPGPPDPGPPPPGPPPGPTQFVVVVIVVVIVIFLPFVARPDVDLEAFRNELEAHGQAVLQTPPGPERFDRLIEMLTYLRNLGNP